MKKDYKNIIKQLNTIKANYITVYNSDSTFIWDKGETINDITKQTARRAVMECVYPLYTVSVDGTDRTVELLVKATLAAIMKSGIKPALTPGADGECVIARWMERGVKYASVLDLA